MLLSGVLLLCLLGLSCGAKSMTSSWAVQVTSGGKQTADTLATKHGFINLGLVGNLKDVYHFQKLPTSGDDVDISTPDHQLTETLKAEENVGSVQQQERRKMSKKQGYELPDDPKWPEQWYLLNTGQLNPADTGNDLNVERAWLQGLTGCGRVVAIVDDGLEYTHDDLKTNYVASLQYDFVEEDDDPFPDVREEQQHGTNVAGVIAMEKGNGECGVGVAYNTAITGLRLISEEGSTDMDEAEALTWKNDIIEIYSNSWGPVDTGREVSGPGPLLQMALKTSTEEGRGGKGSIYVFAAGNGGRDQFDTCAADGYTNSIYTISVGSASSNGNQTYFDESCSGKMVVAIDRNPYTEIFYKDQVITTNTNNSCYNEFSGTSASTVFVSGILALLLEANPELTWRDVQYLLAYTSNTHSLVDGQWTTNAAGLQVSHKFGFGAIDAEALVTRGRYWTSVPAQLSQEIGPIVAANVLENGTSIEESFMVESDIIFLEHVVVVFSSSFINITEEQSQEYVDEFFDNFSAFYSENRTITWPQRGKITISLTSPSGTTSTLLPLRRGDRFPASYDNWSFLSVHFWGERPSGDWSISVSFTDTVAGSIEVEVPSVRLYGTSQVPQAVSRLPTECSPECDPSRGCAANGEEFCDACAQLRVSSTLECTSVCAEGLSQRNGYCYDASLPETVCSGYVGPTLTPSPSPSPTVLAPSLAPALTPALATLALVLVLGLFICTL